MAKTHVALVTLVLCLGSSPALYAQVPNCIAYNRKTGPFPTGSADSTDHITGAHLYDNAQWGQCNYSGVGWGLTCDTTAIANSSTVVTDNGLIRNPLLEHVAAWNDANGIATAQGAASASSTGGGGVAECPAILGCSFSVSIAGTGISFSGHAPLWGKQSNYTNSCPAHALPKKPQTCGDGPMPCPTGERWSPISCTCQPSPIIIDTTGKGFHFTDPETAYVSFDMKNNGHLMKLSWPDPESGNAWLVYDRDGDGKIDSGAELFGTFSPHADGIDHNPKELSGWKALAWYDLPKQGGNLDGIIDSRDKIWPKLKLWIDRHCYLDRDAPCSALPDELFSLESKGVYSISLVYTLDGQVDQYRNTFDSYSLINVEKGQRQKSKDGRRGMDVYLQKKR